MFLFAFAALGAQAAAGTVSVSYELNGKTVSFSGATLREVNDKMRTYWEVNGDGCAYNAEKLPADGTGTLTWTVSGTVEQGEYLKERALVLPSLSGGYIYRDGTYRWKKIEVKADAPGATIISNPTFDVWHSYLSTGTDTTTVTGVTLQGGLYVVPHGTVTFDGCTFTGQLRVPNGDGAFAVTGCTFTGETAAQDSNGYVMHYQAAGTLAFTGNTVADGYRRGLNIDNKDLTATVEKNKLGTTTDAGRSAIQISKCVKLAVTGNEIKLNGGNAFTFHETLLGLSAAPEVSISGNTVTGTGYLIYDDAVANGKAFTSDSLKLTYAADNVVAETVNTTQGVKGTTEYALSGTVATTLHSVDFAAFVKALTDAGYTFDGSTHALAQNGKLTVKWSPVSGCYDTREGHECTVGNVAATANTPKRVNSGLTQFQLFEGESHAVNVKNVAFVYEPAAFTVCENSGWKGTFTAEQAPAGQIYLMNTGNVTFEGCSFDKVVLTSFNCTGTSTVTNCSFKNVYNSYAVKDIRGKKVAVTGCTFENCGAAVMVSSTVKVGAVTISGNTFKNVDVAGTTPDDKVGTRGLVQIASSGDYAGTAFDFSDNKATDCGPVLRQLNSTVSFGTEEKAQLNTLASAGGSLYTTDSIKRVVAKVGETAYETLDEAIEAVQDGETIVVNAGEYKLNGSLTYKDKAFTIQAAADAKVAFDMSEAVALHDAKITFSGVTFNYKTNKDYTGLQHADTLVYNDCTVNGKVFLYAASETFTRCTFVQEVEDYNVWTYGAKSVTFNDCTFKNVGKTINAYIEGGNASSEPQKIEMADCTVESSKSNKAVVNIKNKTQAYDITLTGKNEVSGIAVNETTKSAWYQVETTDSTDQSCKAVSVTEVKDDGTKDVVYVVKPYVAAFVTVTGIAGFADRKYASFAEAYAAIKPTIEKLGLVQESATADAFDALFTSVDANGNATLTYTISGTVVYDETVCTNLLTMGRKASHYGNGRHLINFKFVGATGKEADTLTVNSNITLPYEWWSEKTTTGIHFENLTITGSAPSGLYPSQPFFEGIDFSVSKCALKGIKIYNCSNVEGSYTITDSVLDGTGAPANSYAIHLQGNETAPLSINIKGNTISGYDRGINIDQKTAVATIERNTISVKDAGRSCIQLSSLATADIVGNTLELTGGNAITLHENLLKLSAAPEVSISGNKVTGTGYLIYDDAKANDKEFTSDSLKLTYATDNTVAETVDTTKGVKGSTAYITSTAVNNAVQHYVAQVGTTGYTTLAAAIAALSAENHTLTLLNENAWDATTPVYWAAGTQSGYVATLTDALTAAYKANEGAITIVCRPGADVGEMTHGHVADDLTIYGNDAYLSGGECDLEVDTYTFSRATGKQAADGVCLDKDITITAYELDNLGVWGQRHTANTVTVNLTDCDGKALEGKTNVQRVYISGTTGVNNITLTDCDFLTKATAVYSNADGAIKAVNCSFTGGQVPFNINHKANGTQTVAVENCTFTNCGDAGDWKQFAAPLRLVNSGTGTQSAEVTGCAFAGTVGANGDILLGDGRTGQASNDVELKVVNTAANIQAQKPGYYNGETVDATKKATVTSPESGTLETSVAKLLPVDPRTLGYATSGKAEALPAAPDMSGEVVNVTAAQAQYVLDGAYGPIDGKTINFTESINDTLILGRASKYDGSKTVYRHGSHAGEALSYADFIAYKNQSGWTESCYYERTVENVTFTANEGVTVKNFEADGGAHIYAGTAPVYDYVRDTGSWVTEGSCYFKRAILQNITFKGLTFKAKTDINTSESTTVYDGFTFKDCTFDLGTTADGNQAIRYYNENNNGNVKNLVVEGCTFKTCSQGVYTMQVKGITVKDSTFTQTGHNAIAIQSQGGDKGPCNHGEVVITGNTMVNIGDRAIRFNVVAAGTTITITGNTAAYGDGTTATDKQCIKAETLAEGVTTTVELNNWNNYAVAANKPLTETVAKIGTTDYKSLEDATEAAQGSDVITIVGYTSNMTAPDGWKFETADGVTTLVADPVLLKGADGKFHIASCDDLLLFRKMVNEKGMYFLGETVVLDKDIDMVSVENWTPIGNAPEKKFAGTFDGQNHTISGLKITGGSYVGLFGYLGAATVQNVALVGANVSGVKRVGALVGQIAGNATIKNCSLDATSSVAGSDSNTGGLIGEASGSIVVTLENLTNNAPVTNTESGTSRAAGILCQATSGASVTLKNCVNKGTITTNGGYAGGIVSAKQGGASLVFDGCSNTGTLANGTKGTGALLAWSCNGSSVTISNYSGDVANAIGWLSQDNYDHVFVINGVEHYIRVAKGGSGYTFASRYEAAQLMNKSYLQEIIGFFNYAKTVNPNFEGYPATPVEVLKSAYSTSDESIKGSLFNTDVSSGWPQLLSAYNVKSGKSLTADDFAVTWGTRDVLFMVSDPVTVVVTDTASAQAALDAATPNTTIIFKSGTYEPLFIRQTLEKSMRRSDLDKDGSYPAYLRSFKNLTLIAEVGAEVVSKGITAEAGLFWHASAPASNQAEMRPMGGFISYLALENVTIDGIAFDSTEQSAVTLRDNGAVPTRGNIMVDGLTIQNCTGRGVASNENIHFLAAGGGTNDQNFPGTEKKSFNNIVVKNCELDSYYQPIAFNNATAVLNGLTVTGNTFSNNGNSNVLQLSNKVNSGAFVIENNLFKDLNGRVVRATNSTANWTITGNRLDKPIMYDDSGDLDLVKISVKAETVGAAVTESENDWNTGTLANGTYIANGDPALLPVARIGENKYYHSLQAAFDAAQDGETVKLLADVTVAGQLVAEKALTLDLGGKTVTSTYANGGYAFLTRAAVTVKNGTFAAGQARALSAYANLTLEDATITSELAGGNCCVAFSAANCVYTVVNTKIVGAYAIANFAHNATIAITGSTLEGSGCGLYHNGSNYGLKLTVSDTTINGAIDQAIGEGKDPSGVYLSGSSEAIANAANQNGAHGRHQATFTRCTIKGNTGVEVKYTDLTLEDCTVVATTKEPSYTQNNNGMAALGFAVVSTDNATGNATPKPEGTITITGADGSYTGLVGLGSLDSVKTGFADFEDAHYAVSGGTFSTAVLPEYCAAGFIPTANDDGTYGVKAGAYVAAIGTTGYETLEAALAAADAGATVKMLADVVLTEKQTIAKAVVLDLNGKTISSMVNQFITIAKGGDLTVNDATGEGRIENTTTEFWGGTILMTGGVLTVNGGTLAANTAAGAYSPVIEAKSSVTINVAGGRIEANRTGSVNAIQLGQNADATLNVTGGTIFGGKIGVYSYQCTGNVSVGNRVNVSGGEIIGKSGNAVYAAAKTGLSISGGTLTPGGTAAALAIGGGSTTASSCTVTVGREGGVVGDVTIPSIDFKPGYSANMATVNLLSGIVQKFLNFDRMTVATVSQGKDKLLVGTDITACLPGSELLCQLDAASGLYEIVKLTVENAAAIVTHNGVETLYRTVQQARTAVADDDTLTLKMDYTGSLGITKKNVTIDLGGKTLTGASNSHALSFNQSAAGDNTVTVKNGTIVAKGQDAACIRATSGDAATTLTLVLGDDLTLEVGSNNWSGKVVLDKGARTASPRAAVNNGGLLVTEDGTDWIYGETETAFTHAAGTEVTLLNDWYCTDYEGAVKVPDTSAFGSAKLNLDGHTIKHYGAGAAIVMGNDAKPSEGTAVKTLEISNGMIETSQYGAAVCGSNKSLTLDGVSVKTTGDDKLGIYANGMTSGNTVTLKNGSAVVSEKATGIYFPGAGTLTVEDSNVTGGVGGIEVRAGVLNVSGTSVIASTAAAFNFTNDNNGITTTGAAVAAVKHTVGNDLAVTIAGGTFKGPRGFYENDPNADKPGTVTVSISGGAFSTDVEKKYLADGCKTVQKTIDGAVYYVVGPAVTQIEVTLGDVKKLLPFADDWLTKNIDTEASGWTTAALEEKATNELAKWQCYLFGLDPNKKEAKVVATAGQGTDETIPLAVANADASASPLVTGGYVTVAYVLKGSNDGTAWTQVATSDKRDGLAIPLTDTTYKFYRVDVTVTSAEGN